MWSSYTETGCRVWGGGAVPDPWSTHEGSRGAANSFSHAQLCVNGSKRGHKAWLKQFWRDSVQWGDLATGGHYAWMLDREKETENRVPRPQHDAPHSAIPPLGSLGSTSPGLQTPRRAAPGPPEAGTAGQACVRVTLQQHPQASRGPAAAPPGLLGTLQQRPHPASPHCHTALESPWSPRQEHPKK